MSFTIDISSRWVRKDRKHLLSSGCFQGSGRISASETEIRPYIFKDCLKYAETKILRNTMQLTVNQMVHWARIMFVVLAGFVESKSSVVDERDVDPRSTMCIGSR